MGQFRQDPGLPHRMIFDIDPDEGLAFADVKQAALDIRDILEAIGLKSWPLLSGGKGVHVVVPFVPEADWARRSRASARTLPNSLPGPARRVSLPT